MNLHEVRGLHAWPMQNEIGQKLTKPTQNYRQKMDFGNNIYTCSLDTVWTTELENNSVVWTYSFMDDYDQHTKPGTFNTKEQIMSLHFLKTSEEWSFVFHTSWFL